jgi:ribosome-binding protein aMBF1 (putative translation factor)
MSEEDWKTIKTKRHNKKPYQQPEAHQESETVVLSGKAKVIKPVHKTVPKNKTVVTESGIPSWKVEKLAEEGEFKHKSISVEVRLKIQEGRRAKNWTQKDLATRTNLPLSTIQGYESGTVIPNGVTLNNIGSTLNIKLS